MAVPTSASERRAVKSPKGGLERRSRYGILFCLPFVLAFLVFNIYPVFRTLQMSFMNYKGFGKGHPAQGQQPNNCSGHYKG